MPETKEKKEMWYAYGIGDEKSKRRWPIIGVGFDNKDGSINVIMQSNPVNGKFQLRRVNQHEEATQAQ